MQIRHFGKCRDERLVIQSDITLTFIAFVIGMFMYLYDIFITQVKRFFQIYCRFLINRDELIFALNHDEQQILKSRFNFPKLRTIKLLRLQFHVRDFMFSWSVTVGQDFNIKYLREIRNTQYINVHIYKGNDQVFFSKNHQIKISLQRLFKQSMYTHLLNINIEYIHRYCLRPYQWTV